MITDIPIETFMERMKEYDLIIDARSPHEYAESHIPGAMNYWALDDPQHKEVGTLYKQVSAFQARVVGASYVCTNAAGHIHRLYPAFTPAAKIAIYCARGGMRSASMATIFSSIGYRLDKLIGGYKSFRGHVSHCMEHFPEFRFIVLRGDTGCGKSDLLEKLDNVLELEKLANHYGSTFGAVLGEQPSVKAFQNAFCHALSGLDPSRPVFVEGESKKMGRLYLPKRLLEMMGRGIQVEISAPLEQRVARILRMYADVDRDFFYQSMEKIRPYIKGSAREEAIAAFEAGDLATVARVLLVEYYDKVYKKGPAAHHTLYNDDEETTLSALRALQKEEA